MGHDLSAKDLHYFLAICEKGSIRQAADSLYVTPQALSHHLLELEQELAAKLFLRSAKGLTLTEYGVVFRKYAISMLNSERRMRKSIRALGKQAEKTLSTAFSYDVTGSPVYARCLIFLEAHSEYTVAPPLFLSNKALCEKLAATPGLVGVCPRMPGKSTLSAVPLEEWRFTALVNRAHPLSAERVLTAQMLAGQTLAAMPPDTAAFHLLENSLRQAGGTPPITSFFADGVTARGLCSQNPAVIAVLPEYFLEGVTGGYELRALPLSEEFPTWSISLLYQKDTRLPAPAAHLVAEISKAFSQGPR